MNLRDRLKSVRYSSLSLPAESNHHAVPSTPDAFHECQSPESVESEVILNLHIMESEMGLRPAGHARRLSQSSSRHSSAHGTPSNDVEDPLEETDNSPLTVDDNGQLRYFGYSSYMRMVSVLPQAKAKSPQRQRGPFSPGDNSIDIDGEAMADSPETQTHLIGLFFKYQNAAIPILDEETFRQGYSLGERSDYFSWFLLYSLLLRSLNFDDDLVHRETLATIYTRRAKAELLFEMENPTLSTIPGLCLFGYYLAGLGSDRACWLYPAYRLVFDFGLHEDCKNLVAAGLLTEVDQRVRQTTLYGCYVLDKQVSSHDMPAYSFQGRPTAIRLDDLNMTRLSAQSLGTSNQLVATWVELASLLNDVLSVINGPPEKIYEDLSVKRLSQVSRKLLAWFLNLAPELQWDATRSISPSVCALHLQFLSTTILLNRPFATYIFNRGPKSAPRRRCLEGQTTKISQQICTANAIRVSKLLLTYRQHHGASKIFSTINPTCLSAAVALISDIVSAIPDEDKEAERKWLSAIMETLDAIIPWYPVAERSRNTLAAIMNTCGLSDIVKQLAVKSRNIPVAMLPSHGPTDASGTGWNTDVDFAFDLEFPFDSVYDVHNISLTGFYAQPSQMNFGNWGTEDPLYGLNL
ncbi:hypothetical protein N7517_004483 [Penicillium concentricum]|uniref:Xylanolytic transcriptional activator regulatory domain-containing protein n=1 Tax=Penicillium concentricum TaxID=293559 RepID=A0A9W9V8A0_9EURO|nr:uncharacterized protein N7517_004483 [Penicillium concentricum]KAJ5372477.1 hypothetical protein N7517_004483 [Penicillium concentricum]